MYDYLVVGAGLFGAVFTQQAIECDKSVLVIEKRNHIGGNCYTEVLDNIIVHKYGPHIFHTNDMNVWNYINRFAAFNDFINSPVAFFKGQYYQLPFNMNTFRKIWGNVSEEQVKGIIADQRKEINGNPKNLEEQAISLVGRDVYTILIKGYTEKQWGRDCKDLPADIIKRIPARFDFNDNYYDAIYQGIPMYGYTGMIEKMLSGATLLLNTDYLQNKDYFNSLANKIVFTGPIDSYFNYVYGPLQYRRVVFESEKLPQPIYQNNAVVNYTDKDIPFTRIIEHKWFNKGNDYYGNKISHTIISKEYSVEWKTGDDPYYPINDIFNNKLYNSYYSLAKSEEKILFGGRLGTYKYLDMDQVVSSALDLAKTELFNDKNFM